MTDFPSPIFVFLFMTMIHVSVKDDFQSVLRNLHPAVFVSLTRRNVNSQDKNSGTNLPFSSFLMPDRYPCQTIITSRRASTLSQTDVAAHRAFVNVATRNGGLKNFMYAITEV